MTIVRRTAWLAAIRTGLALFAMALISALPGAPAWAASPGGVSSTSALRSTAEAEVPTQTGVPTEAGEEATGTVSKARLVGGRALAPLDAPAAVRNVIAAANRIRTKPYVWGGGHGRWWDRGYDCSGAVSYALRGGSLLSSPLTSGSLMRWGGAGAGRWITVYAHGGHTYAVIAGLRWDTSMTGGNGPRWSTEMRSSRGFVARHPVGY
jgi:cell wall-associated NlpC family hydrolase